MAEFPTLKQKLVVDLRNSELESPSGLSDPALQIVAHFAAKLELGDKPKNGAVFDDQVEQFSWQKELTDMLKGGDIKGLEHDDLYSIISLGQSARFTFYSARLWQTVI